MFEFVSHDDHIDLVGQWAWQGQVYFPELPLYDIFDLKKMHKHQIVIALHRCKGVSEEAKGMFLRHVLGKDRSYAAMTTRATCMATTPDKEVKAKVWKALTEPHSELSINER